MNEMRICTKTVMDTSDPDIVFDKQGISNYWYDYKNAIKTAPFIYDNREELLLKEIHKIKKEGQNNKYDCIVGVSGGVDSTYVAYLAKKLGLRALLVHYDNGWNSELAVQNVENIVRKLDYDLFTLVVNWEEFRQLQLAYLRASVVDIEVPTDHAITGTIHRLAKKYNVKYLLSGSNIQTEFIMPNAWIYSKNDSFNLKDIFKKFGDGKLKTYPIFSFFDYVYYGSILKIKTFNILNYIDYNKAEVKKIITQELGWRDYGGKHYESLFTKFYQAYILPQKFGIDKRKAHLSTLICSGQISREEALEELKLPLYDPNELINDKEYVLKKFGLTEQEFETIMHTPPRPHANFKSDIALKRKYMKLLRNTERIRRIIKS